MKLLAYIRREGISVAAFGRKIGVSSRVSMGRYASEGYIPPPEVIEAIYVETHGEVTPNDFYKLPDIDRRAAA